MGRALPRPKWSRFVFLFLVLFLPSVLQEKGGGGKETKKRKRSYFVHLFIKEPLPLFPLSSPLCGTCFNCKGAPSRKVGARHLSVRIKGLGTLPGEGFSLALPHLRAQSEQYGPQPLVAVFLLAI